MLKKRILSFVLLIFFIPHLIYADTEVWAYLDNITDQALLLTKQKKYHEAKQLLEHFSEEFVRTHPKEDHITMNDLRVISISTDEAIKALVAISMEHEERVRRVSQLRLAMDALHSKHQPMWMEMEKTIISSFQNLKEAALKDDKEKFKLTFNTFMNNFDTIYPSLVIDLGPDKIAKLDSHIRFLETYDRVTHENKQNHLQVMEKDIYKLFGKTITDIMDPSLIWVMITTGGVIFTVLMYVGIKKYKAERITIINYRVKK